MAAFIRGSYLDSVISTRIIRFYRIWQGFSNPGELSAISCQLSAKHAESNVSGLKADG
jgi:hypothetical protein